MGFHHGTLAKWRQYASFYLSVLLRKSFCPGGDVAQLVECRTGTPLTQVRFSGATRDFFFLLELTVGADSLTVSVYPRVQSHTLTSGRF